VHDRPPERTIRGTAFHEAGHAVAALASGFEFPDVSIEPTVVDGVERYGSVMNVTIPTAKRWSPLTSELAYQGAIFYMAGPEAELMETGRDVGREADRLRANALVEPGRTPAEADAEVQRAADEARALVMACRAEVRALAEALLEQGRLAYSEVVRIAGAVRRRRS